MNNEHDLKTLTIDDTAYATRHTRKFSMRKPYQAPDPARLLAFIPGLIQTVSVKAGDTVRWGDPLLVLEAMKMKNDVTSPRDGVIRAVHVSTGEKVMKNQLLIEFEEAPSAPR
jgi:biotin carboxyl carrier protein